MYGYVHPKTYSSLSDKQWIVGWPQECIGANKNTGHDPEYDVPQLVHQASLPEVVAIAVDEIQTVWDTFILCKLFLIIEVKWPTRCFRSLWQEESKPSLGASLSCDAGFLIRCSVISSIQSKVCSSWAVMDTFSTWGTSTVNATVKGLAEYSCRDEQSDRISSRVADSELFGYRRSRLHTRKLTSSPTHCSHKLDA